MGSAEKLNGIDNVQHEIEVVVTEANILKEAIKELQDNYELSETW